MPLKLHLEALGSGVKRLYKSQLPSQNNTECQQGSDINKKTPNFHLSLFDLWFLKAKLWGWCTNFSFESLEWAVQYTWGCCKYADLLRLLAASFTLTPAALAEGTEDLNGQCKHLDLCHLLPFGKSGRKTCSDETSWPVPKGVCLWNLSHWSNEQLRVMHRLLQPIPYLLPSSEALQLDSSL